MVILFFCFRSYQIWYYDRWGSKVNILTSVTSTMFFFYYNNHEVGLKVGLNDYITHIKYCRDGVALLRSILVPMVPCWFLVDPVDPRRPREYIKVQLGISIHFWIVWSEKTTRIMVLFYFLYYTGKWRGWYFFLILRNCKIIDSLKVILIYICDFSMRVGSLKSIMLCNSSAKS